MDDGEIDANPEFMQCSTETVLQGNLVCKDLQVPMEKRDSLEWMVFLGQQEKEETQVCVSSELQHVNQKLLIVVHY